MLMYSYHYVLEPLEKEARRTKCQIKGTFWSEVGSNCSYWIVLTDCATYSHCFVIRIDTRDGLTTI
uniref:Uncharacterized protein n=1 Tax=Arion vulgaris TaxID=1028688 RepID=A0A0B7B2N3_9EUPU